MPANKRALTQLFFFHLRRLFGCCSSGMPWVSCRMGTGEYSKWAEGCSKVTMQHWQLTATTHTCKVDWFNTPVQADWDLMEGLWDLPRESTGCLSNTTWAELHSYDELENLSILRTKLNHAMVIPTATWDELMNDIQTVDTAESSCDSGTKLWPKSHLPMPATPDANILWDP